MKIVVVGLGSMGRRRVRLLKQISNQYKIIGIDNQAVRRHQAEKEFGIITMDNLKMAVESTQANVVIVSASPLAHGNIINEALKLNCHVFSELNLVDDMYEENITLAKEKNKVLFLSSTFLYREEIKYIKECIEKNKGLINYNYHTGQYLKDWHPWESIQDYFVANKRTNGCRELFAIELPWLIKVFGDIQSFEVLSSKNTELNIQYNDNYLLLIKHKNGNKGVLAIDVISRKAVRNLEIYGENLYLTWNGTPSGLRVYDHESKEEKTINFYKNNVDKQEGYASFIIENAYKKELESFIKLINREGKAEYTFEEDWKILALIDKIEER